MKITATDHAARVVPESMVLISGAGIGGLALGTALARTRIAVDLVERAAQPRSVGAGLVLYPNGIRALAAISPALPAAVMAAGHVPSPTDVRPILNQAGDVLAVDRVGDLAERYGVPQVSVLRSVLESVLLREATRAGARVERGLSVIGHADGGGCVEVRLSDGSVRTAAALVSAEGLHSATRQRLLGDGPPRYCGYTTVRGQSPADASYPHGLIATGRGAALFVAPLSRDWLYWTAKLVAEPGTWPAKGPDQALADLISALADWHPPIVDIVRNADIGRGLVVADIHDRDQAENWTFGRVTLLGDAAHPMTPGAGQGASMALEDAAVLAALLGSDRDPRRALRAYAIRRLPRTSRVVRQSRQRDTFVRGGGRDFSTEDGELTGLLGWQPDRAAPVKEFS
jgi:2-polyprenyl-6-methoxyphenol hydroxylase-like FAD-dependent oxidoreductase